MKAALALLSLAALASCATAPPHTRGGYHRGANASSRSEAGAQFGPQQLGPAAQRPARPGADPDAVLIAGFDENFDLIISASEITDGIAREFARADRDHDHIVSRAEFAVWSERAFGGPYPPHWLAFDADGDGRINAAEFADQIRALTQRHDTNGDGVIDHAELVVPDIARAETADAAIGDDDRRPSPAR